MNKKNTSRHLSKHLSKARKRQLILLTGARQTGKTTLVNEQYPKLPYFNLDAPEIRDQLQAVPSHQWHMIVKDALLDEIQKAPQLFEKIKYSYDAGNIDFSVLTGSSQILLLKKVSESLAGRISIYELFPLMFSELCGDETPLLQQLLQTSNIDALFNQTPAIVLNETQTLLKSIQNTLCQWGGMPALLHLETDQERWKWLKDYEYTYLQRDLSDLARLDDLEPFKRFQKLSALRAAKLLNYSELARDAGISTDTARRYLQYLTISYQTVLLQPYYQNATSSSVKTPKLYWLDMGIMRSLTNLQTGMTGDLFENYVIAEVIKWIRTNQSNAECYFYRTHSGTEVDLLLKTSEGIIGIEIKQKNALHSKDTRALRELAVTLKDDWLGGIVIYEGDKIEKLSPGIWVIPAWRMFAN